MINKFNEFFWDHFRLIFVIFITSLILCSCGQELIFDESIRATVTDKGIKRQGKQDIYLIYTKDENGNIHVFKDTDNLLLGKFNSSDIYADLEVGYTYIFYTKGLRIPILSEYPNIIKYK